MNTLRPHLYVLDKTYPPSSTFDHLIDKKLGAAHGHWYWDGDFHDDTVDRTPIFKWRALSPDRRVGKYVVARLLWIEANPGTYSRLTLRNTCGVFACVNPAHWENPHRERWWTLPADVDASLVNIQRNGWPARIHIRSNESLYTMCAIVVHDEGASTLPASEGHRITCETCLAAWQSLNRPLDELPVVEESR